MLHIFRDIRLKELFKGKGRRYLIYAAGEILLVVAGILIAFQVDTWSKNQDDRYQEQILLKNLKEEIQTNIIELQRDHTLNENSLYATLALLSKDNVRYSTEKVDSLLGVSYNFATFDPRSGVLEQIINSDGLSLIQDEELKYMISQWSGEMDDLREDVVIRRDYWIHNVSEVVEAYLPLRNTDKYFIREDYPRPLVVEPIELDKSNYIKFFRSQKVDAVLYQYYINQTYVYTNEESIGAYLNRFKEVVERNIHHE